MLRLHTVKCERFEVALADEPACVASGLVWAEADEACFHSFLSADYSVSCDDERYKTWLTFAGLMVGVYPCGVPLLFWLLLRRSHRSSGDGSDDDDDGLAFIQEAYLDEYYWCVRRVCVACVLARRLRSQTNAHKRFCNAQVGGG